MIDENMKVFRVKRKVSAKAHRTATVGRLDDPEVYSLFCEYVERRIEIVKSDPTEARKALYSTGMYRKNGTPKTRYR